jgi:HD-GYP domain-containing protein (c-di-GMP phosphodiesterase class II)
VSPSEAWEPLLATLVASSAHDERLDGVLRQVLALTGLDAAYVYVFDDTGDRLHLVRGRGGPVEGLGGDVEGGAEAIGTGPPLDFQATPADGSPHMVATAVGPLYSVPLDGVGVLQVGPLKRNSAPARVRKVLADVAFPIALVVGRTREEEQLRSQLASLAARVAVGRRLAGSALDVDRYIELLLELALRSTRTEAGFVAIVGEDGALAIRAESGLPAGFARQIDLSPETGVFDWSPASEGGALVLRALDSAAEVGIRSILAMPLIEGDVPLGVFALLNFGESGTFDEGSIELLSTFADQIRQMLHNERLFEDFTGRYLETVRGLCRSLDIRRPYTHGHHERVARNAASIAAALGHGEDAVEALHAAGLVHDAGMAGGSDYQSDIDHPVVGSALVEQLPLHPWVAEGVAAHHEWWDGWGFPQGLAGEAIPPAGRILAAAEFLDEMSSGDPVREAWGVDRLVVEIEARTGKQLEPAVADAAIRLLRQDGIVLGAPSS